MRRFGVCADYGSWFNCRTKKVCFCVCLETDKITKALCLMCCYIHQQHTTGQRAVVYAWAVGAWHRPFPDFPQTSRVSIQAISPHLSNSEADTIRPCLPVCLFTCVCVCVQNAANPIVFMYVFDWKHFVTSKGQARSCTQAEISAAARSNVTPEKKNMQRTLT